MNLRHFEKRSYKVRRRHRVLTTALDHGSITMTAATGTRLRAIISVVIDLKHSFGGRIVPDATLATAKRPQHVAQPLRKALLRRNERAQPMSLVGHQQLPRAGRPAPSGRVSCTP